jgi:glycosidase
MLSRSSSLSFGGARRVALAAALVGAVAVAVACGSSDVTNRDYGQPPDPSSFNPGTGGGSDPYGYGGGPGKVECPAELKRCSHTITYPAGNEGAVELRGDWDGASTWDAGKPMVKKGSVWTVDIEVPLDKPVQYKFIVDGEWTIDPAQPTITDGNNNTNNVFAGKTCDPAICQEEGQLPPGVFDWRDAVIYFVFVDRFFDGNPSLNAGCKVSGVSGPIADYQGGDWAGVKQKIDEGYFDDLGVNTLWITVPFENPSVAGRGVGGDDHLYSGYHGYWPKLDGASDPAALSHESCFGSFADLKALVSAAHAKGLKVLFDYAMVHVHDSSQVYQQHKDWFWPNSKGGSPDCVCGGQYCKWETDPERCWFADYLPHWNYTNAAGRAWSVANAVAWITQTADSAGNGVDGFRADAIKHVDVSWLTELRAKIETDVTAKQSPAQRFYMVGETYDFGNRDLIKSFVDPATKLDGQFDFPLRRHVVESTLLRTARMSDLASFMDSNDYFYGANAVMSTFVGNHDLPRVIHLAANARLWGDDQGADGKDRAWSNQPGQVGELEAYERLANAFAILFTNRGAPLVYYGDEIGMPGAGDPDNRRFMQWGSLDSNQSYLKGRLKTLADVRSKHPALRRGTRQTLGVSDDTWVFARTTTGDTVYVAVNRSDAPKQVTGLPAGPLDDLVSSQPVTGPTITVPPRQTRILVVK